jgi:ribosomal protein L22
MEAKAQARYVRVTPQKARRVVDLIRGKLRPSRLTKGSAIEAVTL